MTKKTRKSKGGSKEEQIAGSSDKNAALSGVIGAANVNRWIKIKNVLNCKNNEEFVRVLLDLASIHLVRNNVDIDCDKDPDDQSKQSNETVSLGNNLEKNESQKKITKCKKQSKQQNEETVAVTVQDQEAQEAPKEKQSLIVTISNEHFIPLQNKNKLKEKSANENVSNEQKITMETKQDTVSNTVPKFNKINVAKGSYDVRKAPKLEKQELEVNADTLSSRQESRSSDSATLQPINDNLSMCSSCETRHLPEQCPIFTPLHIKCDALTQQQYLQLQRGIRNSDEEKSFARLSLPNCLKLDQSPDANHGVGVFVNFDEKLEPFTQFGPLIGKDIKAVDIPEDCNMRDMYEINVADKVFYVSTSDLEHSNWLRFIRPAPVRDIRNLVMITSDNSLYFVTTRKIYAGEELLYWQDNFTSNNKKKSEKSSCGGCNMTFLHPLYYRIHCSVFHDVRYSLTIRKYHCKVCGAAVLGKENIMKHATELHNGQGAYQCQFCKKFFLRLNYLEMHRTYGCSANPHRSRPLCDFCGRKFCQPQKLKVHIKRMHSDMSEVLKEFQCKNCLKLLGSRAALQRHFKEVHKKQVEVSLKCGKCGKMFQNKSNLKIHMLTHSGIKPFKCNQSNCAAAFTTKQCLQFHYKKVHSFTEEEMPKIERSVDYTFEAYSGNEENAALMDTENDSDARNQKGDDSSADEDDDLNLEVEKPDADDPPALYSPAPLSENDHESNSASPPTLEAYAPNMKILSKGSKKWIGEQSELYEIARNKSSDAESAKYETLSKSSAPYDASKLPTNSLTFTRHESSNASLLVEAALDSVCSEPNIDIDVSTTTNCTDSLVNNLYTLSQNDSLVADVTYAHSVDVNDSRDINLISPSVNDHISVTDDDLRQTQTIGIDYSSFHQEDFSPPNSPRNNFRDYMNGMNGNSPTVYEKVISPGGVSPPRYDFSSGNNLNPESDDSNGIGVQNLSLHNGNDSKEDIQLDLSIYKSHYSFDSNQSVNFLRKETTRSKFSDDSECKSYSLDNEDTSKFSLNGNVDAAHDNIDNELKELESMDEGKMHKEGDLDLSMRSSQLVGLTDLRSKFELDLDLRKSYDVEADLRRNAYELDDFRMKNYEIDSLDTLRSNLERNKTYESLIEDFRVDRNFEPVIINPSELQGLDMSARGYHNYPNLNRYHPLYPPEVDRPSVDLRLNYSPPPPPTYPHADILRHSVDLSLRSQIANSRLLSEHSLQTGRLSLEQPRLLTSDLSAPRHISAESRLISDMSNRILSDHTTNRILGNDQLTNRLLSNDQRIIPSEDARLMSEQSRLLDQNRLLGPSNGNLSPVSYTSYSVSPSPYHPTALPPRPHATSPNGTPYHHYSAYY